MKFTGANPAARDAAAALLDTAHGFPARGTHAGGGVHVPMPGAWDGVGPVPPGWTSFRGHRNDGDGAVFLPDEPETQTKLDRLTGPERAALAQVRAAAVGNDARAAKEL